jgi:cytochrome c oxidase cbb3-type subunit 3
MTKPSRHAVANWTAGLVLACAAIAAGVFLRSEHAWAGLLRADPGLIPGDPTLMEFALERGAPVFAAHCAACHGANGKGDPVAGVPELTDSDWLYGAGEPGEIERIVSYGIRAHNSKTRDLATMPAFARAAPSAANPGLNPLSPGDIRDVVEFLFYLEKRAADAPAAARGAKIFSGRGGCYDCHGSDGQGDSAVGGPNLADEIWLYGDGSRNAIFNSIAYGRQGMCPGWAGRLSVGEIRAVSLYVYALSHRAPSRGGAAEKTAAASPPGT